MNGDLILITQTYYISNILFKLFSYIRLVISDFRIEHPRIGFPESIESDTNKCTQQSSGAFKCQKIFI
jgi:hypothetical protein